MNKRGYSALAFAVLLALVFGALILSLHFGNAGGGATVEGNSLIIYRCGEVNVSGVYVLNQSISNGTADCLIIRADGITIDGNGTTIYGNVNATNLSSDCSSGYGCAGFSFVLQNITLNGNVVSAGAPDNSVGGAGGNINVSGVVINGSLNSIGGISESSLGGNGGEVNAIGSTIYLIDASGSEGMAGGNGGKITITNSNVTTIVTFGGDDGGATGGSGGEVIVTNSNVTNIISSAYLWNWAEGLGTGANGGRITINSSTVSNVISRGDGEGPGGEINISGSNASNVYSTGEDGGKIFITSNSVISGEVNSSGQPADLGGDGGAIEIRSSRITGSISSIAGGSTGSIYVIHSTTGDIFGPGGYPQGAIGSTGGVVTVINSTTGDINNQGGVFDSFSFGGGSGGNLTIINSTVDVINNFGGDQDGTNGGSGGLILLINSNATSINSYGSAGESGRSAGNGSTNVTIVHSNVSNIEIYGGALPASGGTELAGNGGNLYVYSSTIGNVNASGGDINTGAGGTEIVGSAGQVAILDSSVGLILAFGGSTDVNAGGNGGVLNLTNVTFSGFNVSAGSGGTKGIQGNVTLRWWLDLNVSTAKYGPLSGANVSIYNRSIKLINNQLTDSNGRIVRQTLTEYYYNGTNYYYFSNYTINATILSRPNVTSSVNMSTNRNVLLDLSDTTSPTVSLTSPLTGASYTGEPVDVQFIWDASDAGVGIANCTVWLKGNPYYNSSAITATNNNRTLNLGPADYIANVSCIDYDGNVGNSSVISFTISAPAASSSSVGGGSISYSSGLSEDSSITKSLAYGDQIRFSYSGSGGSESHTLTLDSTNGDSATFTIRSDPITLTMKVNETRKLDLNKDGFYDVLIVLNKIVRGRVDVTIKKINEVIQGKESVPVEVNNQGIQNVTIIPEDKGTDVNNILESVLVVFIIALLIVAVVLARNLKFKKRAGAIRIKSYKGR